MIAGVRAPARVDPPRYTPPTPRPSAGFFRARLRGMAMAHGRRMVQGWLAIALLTGGLFAASGATPVIGQTADPSPSPSLPPAMPAWSEAWRWRGIGGLTDHRRRAGQIGRAHV